MPLFLGKSLIKLARPTSFRCLSSSASSSINTIIDPSFGLTSVQKQLQTTALQFALNEFRPNMREWDEKQNFPRNILKKSAQLGFGGLYVNTENGGSGLTRLETSIIVEALAQGCVSTTAMLCLHNMCAFILSKYANEEIKSRFMSSMISFEKMGSYCITESDFGSDSTSLATTAVKQGDYYIVNGTKTFISGAGESDLYFLLCRTGNSGPKGISCILVEKDTEGLSFGAKEKKLGWNSQPTRSLIMEDCKVPIKNLIGIEGKGFKYAVDGINSTRLNMSSCSLGAAQWALEETIRYTSERKQFNKPLMDFQNTHFKIAKLASELLSYRLLVRSAARRVDEENDDGELDIDNKHIPLPSMAAAAKLVTTEGAYQIIDQCLQLFGGYGYLKDFPIQQLLRDSRVHRILGGTSEIMKLLISRDFIHYK